VSILLPPYINCEFVPGRQKCIRLSRGVRKAAQQVKIVSRPQLSTTPSLYMYERIIMYAVHCMYNEWRANNEMRRMRMPCWWPLW
jgi:hypothetical protein